MTLVNFDDDFDDVLPGLLGRLHVWVKDHIDTKALDAEQYARYLDDLDTLARVVAVGEDLLGRLSRDEWTSLLVGTLEDEYGI